MGYAIKPNGSWRTVADESWCSDDELYTEVQPELTEDTQAVINAEARTYLQSTDWYITRKSETGQDVPDDILVLRQQARQRVKD